MARKSSKFDDEKENDMAQDTVLARKGSKFRKPVQKKS